MDLYILYPHCLPHHILPLSLFPSCTPSLPHHILSLSLLQLYPYHMQDVMVQGLRVTPFSYYCSMMHDMVQNEKSYDSLPNFTAADCELDDDVMTTSSYLTVTLY